MREELTLFELNEFIRRFVALNVPDALWITAEISQANVSRGHRYIDLIQKSEETQQIIAQSYAVLWSQSLDKIASSKSSNITQILKEGLKVKLRVRVDFHEKYGLKLIIEDIDENYTYGNLALERAKIIKRLQAEQLMDKNSQLRLPKLIKRIAVLSSRTAAGFKDFVTHLNANEYGYTFGIELFPIAVQGINVERDFLAQIKNIDWTSFDLLAIIRGGGSKIDLAAFDSYAICKAIAEFPMPVLTGIGHEIDETIADMLSHTSLKTPTAVAAYIIDRNIEFESNVVLLNQKIGELAVRIIQKEKLAIQNLSAGLNIHVRQSISHADHHLAEVGEKIHFLSKAKIKATHMQLQHWEQTIQFLSIENTLRRGFTITRDSTGKVIEQARSLKKGDIISTQFKTGEHKSKIQ